MKQVALLGILGICSMALVAAAPAPTTMQQGAGINWPAFRGPGSCGIAEGFATATTWNAETNDNVLWSTPIPGLSHSSPVVWGDRVFVTTAISSSDNSLRVGLYGDIDPVRDSSEHTWKIYALDKRSGAIVWERTVHTGVPAVMRHTKSTHASAPIAADGKVYFTGEDGDIFVLEAGPEFELLATNQMGEVCMATPAISEGMLLFRTQGHVVAVAAPTP